MQDDFADMDLQNVDAFKDPNEFMVMLMVLVLFAG